jgi:hypothetical protein
MQQIHGPSEAWTPKSRNLEQISRIRGLERFLFFYYSRASNFPKPLFPQDLNIDNRII